MPFYIIELADFLSPTDKGGRTAWAEFRKAQAEVADTNKNVTLIKNSDLGEWNDIHPLDKKTLGQRVAAAILIEMNTKTENDQFIYFMENTIKTNEAKGFYKLSWLQRIGFGSGDLAQNLIYQTVCMYLLIFYTNVYGLKPEVAAVMFLIVGDSGCPLGSSGGCFRR